MVNHERRSLVPIARIIAASELRLRWRAFVLLGLIAALWGVVTMSAVAGARRTASVVERFQRTTSASDATFWIEGDRDGEALNELLVARPEVQSADMLWYATTGLAFDRDVFVNIVAGFNGTWGQEFDRAIVVSGRRADPANPAEVMLNTAAAALLDAGPGSRLQLPTFDRQEWDAWQEVRGPFPPFNGPTIDVVVAGVARFAADLSASGGSEFLIAATPAFLDQWAPAVGENARQTVVSLRDGGIDVGSMATQLTLTLHRPVGVDSTDRHYASNLRNATSTVSAGLWVLGIAAGLSGGLLIGFGVARQVRVAAHRHRALIALGATSLQRAIALASPVALVAGIAAIVAVVGAWLVSPVFPIGPGRLAEPTRSLQFDVPVLAGGALVLVAVVVGVAAFAALRRARVSTPGPSRLQALTAGVGQLGPAVMIGHAHAVGSRDRRSTMVVALVTVAGLTATVSFAASLHDLGAEPTRWGYTWSSSPELGFEIGEYSAAIDATAKVPGIAGLALLDTRDALVGDRPVTLSAITNLGDSPIRPRVLVGRLPREGLEIAVGRRTAAALGLDIDDIVTVDSTNLNPVDYRVVGLVIPPYQPDNTHPGEGVVVGASSLEALFPEAGGKTFVLLNYAPSADPAQVEAELSRDPGWVFGSRSHPRRPGEIANLMETSVLVPWLAGFFLALGFGATALSSSRRHTRQARDIEILRALGFGRPQFVRSIITESMIVVTVGLLVGLPVGLALERIAWRLAIGHVGVVETQASVWFAIGAAVTTALAVTATITTATAFGAGRNVGRGLREG